MARRLELGAGIAAAVLSVIALIVALSAPIVTYCATSALLQGCPNGQLRSESLLHAGLDAGVWAYLIGMMLVCVVGAAGAIAEARYAWRFSIVLLWIGVALAFGGCALAANGIGILFLPSVLALCLSAYGALLSRFTARRRSRAEPEG